MFKKSPLKATRLAKRKRKILFLKIGGLVLLILILCAVAVGFTHLGILRIQNIAVQGNYSVGTSAVQDAVVKDLVHPYLGIFSKYNRFIYPKDVIHADLLTQFPRIQSLSLSMQGGHTLVAAVIERTPSYTWCSGLPDDTSSRSCYFMDDHGFVFSDAPIFSGHAYFAYYGMLGDSPISKTYLDAAHFDSINQLKKALEAQNFHPYALVAHDDGEYDLYINQGTKIIFSNDEEISSVIANAMTLIHNSDLFKKESGTLEYIDLRYGDKIYYKYSGDNSKESSI